MIFVDTKTGDIKKQSIITENTSELKDGEKVGILLDPEELEIVQQKLSPNLVRLSLVSGNDYPLPDKIFVNISCVDCEDNVNENKTLNKKNQCLIVQEVGKTYTYTFTDEKGKELLKEERTCVQDITKISDDQYIFTYTKTVPKFFKNKNNFVAGIQLSGIEKDSTYYNQKIEVEVQCLDCQDKTPIELLLDENNRTKLQLTPGKTYAYTFTAENGDVLLKEQKTLPIMIDFGKGYLQVFFYNTQEEQTQQNSTFVTENTSTYESYCGLYFNHNYYYNNNGLDQNNSELATFIDSIKAQLDKGRSNIEIKINASASYVPTRTYRNNTNLAQVRAEKVKAYLSTELRSYLSENRVNIIIESAKVQGPKYDRSQLRNLEKYAPYQFVSIEAQGVNCSTVTQYESIDKKLQELNVVLKPLAVKKETKVNLPKSNLTYHVIVYTYNDRIFAEEVIQSNTYKNNSQAQIVEDESGNFLISIANFKTEQEAKNFIANYKYQDKTNAYIYKKK